MAGESARESARRQREKAERLQRSAELYERGADGERATAEALAQLPADSWTVLHDLRWPGRRYANVDHVVVGPPGVFVVDSKNWSGSIVVSNQVLRQNGRSRETAVAGATEAAMAVGRLAPLLRPDLVRPVLCFVRDEPVTGWARDVMVCSTSNVVSMLSSCPALLLPEQVRQLSLDLDAGLRSATQPPAQNGVRVPAVLAASASRATASRATASRAAVSRPRSRRRTSSSLNQLIRLAVVLLVMGVLASHPGVFTGIGRIVSEQLTSDLGGTTPEQSHHGSGSGGENQKRQGGSHKGSHNQE